MTFKSNLRWCSDGFEIRCWNGERVQVAFSLDCCDREAMAFVATSGHITGEHTRDLMTQTIEARFGPRAAESPGRSNGSATTVRPTPPATRAFAHSAGMVPRNTPAYSPKSNGMAEAFVKTFKRDFVYLAELHDAASVISQLPAWFYAYNTEHPHKGLKMMTPQQFRQSNAA